MNMTSAAIQPWNLSADLASARRLANTGDERAQLEKAAKGFELILTKTWLQSVRNASLDPKTGMMASYQAMSDDQLAAFFVNKGGFGLAAPMVEQMLKQIELRKQNSVASHGAK